jgi:hypothetical protein
MVVCKAGVSRRRAKAARRRQRWRSCGISQLGSGTARGISPPMGSKRARGVASCVLGKRWRHVQSPRHLRHAQVVLAVQTLTAHGYCLARLSLPSPVGALLGMAKLPAAASGNLLRPSAVALPRVPLHAMRRAREWPNCSVQTPTLPTRCHASALHGSGIYSLSSRSAFAEAVARPN